MGALEPSPIDSPERDSHWIPILSGSAFVVLVVALLVWFGRATPQPVQLPPAYAANLKLSDFKIGSAQNFVGATVTYLNGTITNAGTLTVSRVLLHVVFRDSGGHAAQIEDIPLQVLPPGAAEPVDLHSSPLPPGESRSFRLTFPQISRDWNLSYPLLQISEVTAQ